MLNDVFLFAGSIFTYNHNFIYLFHFVLCVGICILLAKFATKSMQTIPSGVQNIMEWYLSATIALGKDAMGSEELARKYLPLVATLGLLIFSANIIGIIPGFESPTASLNMTLSLTLCVFVYYNAEGISKYGAKHYFKHFAGPVKLMAPIMFPIEVISHLSRIISLSFRLFGNIKGDDFFLLVMLTLLPWVVPMIPIALLTFMAFLQTFIFMVLSYVYLAGAVALEEEM